MFPAQVADTSAGNEPWDSYYADAATRHKKLLCGKELVDLRPVVAGPDEERSLVCRELQCSQIIA